MRLLVSDDLRETAALPGVFFGHIDDGIVQSDFNFDFGRQNTAVSFVDFSSLSRYFYPGGHSKRRQADDGVAGFLNVRVLVVYCVYFRLGFGKIVHQPAVRAFDNHFRFGVDGIARKKASGIPGGLGLSDCCKDEEKKPEENVSLHFPIN